MNLALGLDTGGTYTDAVLVDHGTGQVLAGTKALTTRHDLTLGIREAISGVFATAESKQAGLAPADVTLVALSTTLATNSLAEGQGGAVCLMLIGYDAELMRGYGFQNQLGTRDIVYLRGGHDELGNELAPLDEEAACAAILRRRDSVEAFAISGYFAVRNPEHELRVRKLVEELAGLPVTCGHELSSKLNAIRRATTAALNAHLILPLRELIASVQATLSDNGITAPLMVVKGDGSLVRAEWAMQRPIETILSGPAASVVGAWHLAGRRDVWTVDVGGTTTDIAALRDGWPRLNPAGASVGGWRTMVEAVDVHTTGLGGDSQVRFDHEGELCIGPRRVVPLCLLASEHPGVAAELRRQVAGLRKKPESGAGEFVVTGRRPGTTLAQPDLEVLQSVAEGPRALTKLAHLTRAGSLVRRRVEELEARGLIRRAGFTPTDALHVLGRFDRWDVEAARLGATLLAAQAGMPVEVFCESVVRKVADQITTEIVTKVIEDEVGLPDWRKEPTAAALLKRALTEKLSGDLACSLTLRTPLVAIGAPVAAYMPDVAERLHTELVIPEQAAVANAVGAVAGGIIQRMQVLIRPLDGAGQIRVHLPDGVHDFAEIEPAVAFARDATFPRLEAMARHAGAEQVELQVARQDTWAPVAGGQGDEVYLGTVLSFTATGRPSQVRSSLSARVVR